MRDREHWFRIPVRRKENLDFTSCKVVPLNEQLGIQVLVAQEKGSQESKVYTYSFLKEKWKTMGDCRRWIKENYPHCDAALFIPEYFKIEKKG